MMVLNLISLGINLQKRIMLKSISRSMSYAQRRAMHATSTSTSAASTSTSDITNSNSLHKPVMVEQVLQMLQPKPGQLFIDMTFGAGGHTRKLLEFCPGLQIITVDRDEDSYQLALELQKDYPNCIIPLHGRFSDLPALLADQQITKHSIDGILFDFGCSSMQFDRSDRGFSVNKTGPLDMRMDKNRFPDQPTAADVLAKIDEPDLARIIKVYGDEKNAKKIARAIIDIRYALKKLETTKELADVVAACFADDYERMDKLQRPAHLATKTFQALRIFVNNELNEINYGMILADNLLRIGGRMVTIAFHSLEDTIVKRHIVGNLIGNQANPVPLRYSSHTLIENNEIVSSIIKSNWHQLHKHVLTPSTEEILWNPRSRSARLRAAQKLS